MAGQQADKDILAGLAEANHNEGEFEKGRHDYSPDGSLHDGIHDGLVFPTEEEAVTLRRVPDTIPVNTYLIAFVELAERFSYYGSTVVYTNFIQRPLPPGSKSGNNPDPTKNAGALGLGQQTSTGIGTFNTFWVYLIPLFGAYIADTRWGRFKTICISVAVALVGHVILVVSALPPVIAHPNSALGVFIVAIIIMGIGTGGFKSNISPLVAEQYRKTHSFIGTLKSGERVIVDPSLTTSRIYMYFYLFINIGALIGQIGMAYTEKYVGFWVAFLLPTLVFCLCPLVLFIGRNKYARSPPTGSVFVTSLRVLRYAARGRWTLNPMQLYRNLTAPDFYEVAKPSNVAAANNGEKPRWMTFDDQWVDEVRRGFLACKVFLWYPIYWLTYNQLNNNLTSQAGVMTTNGVPNDVISNLDPFVLIIGIPICDLVLYPALRRRGIRFTAIKKIALGFYTGAAAMVWAAVVQYYIYKTNPCGKQAATCMDDDGNSLVSPLSIWIQSGSYILVALSEILASITGLEYAFTKAPKNMRSLVMSVFLFMSAIAAALGEAFVTLSTDPLLVWNYGSMAVLAFIAGTLFWIAHRDLDAREDELNNLGDGHFGADADVVPPARSDNPGRAQPAGPGM